MSLQATLRQFGDVPVSHGVLCPLLADYRRPNDKISDWLADQTLIAVKRGLYVVNPAYTGQPTSLALVANQLYGPSYVSMDYALSHYGLIPERVYQVTSVTTRRAKSYDSPLGRFSYERLPLCVYPIGISNAQTDSGHYYLIASPEKALCDKLMLSPNLNIRSVSAMADYLEHDLRLDMDEVVSLNQALLKQIAEAGVKQRVLQLLCQVLELR